ncbi:Predicted dehydrogenase [Mameliella alba]|uniref:Gfo/Idh/MocA family protein n=1 Tax=Mameliella alba TaxID=561184 RepID=UPI000888B476|nr:Gfo/Idh/MocA family oxidoreductase [Mameliella alba]OWV50479.1 gfo/Idh/MocA family oxidoreductase [Mameliella alba]PTR42096.1 putative dehydrogenase [Mameliella alba]GGF55003.1 oxidoreductase [Mameliella alba]SDB98658.1 Predicted dehydrogenase [Mameliella alba]
MKGALIGCGFFARNQLHGWADVTGAEIVAICDRDETRLAEAGEAFGIDRRYADAAEMFAAGGFDFVDIATTVPSHRPLVEMAAAAGVHVICQKPFALNMDDARAMIAAVEATGKTLMVHENFRWQSAVRAAIEALRGGAIGTPFFGRVSFRSGYDVFSGQPYLAEGERFIIEDLGIHILDIARALFGDVDRISATTRRINPNIRGEDVATMLLSHGGGVTSMVDCSYATRRMPETFPETLLEIDGTEGFLRLDAGYRLTIQRDGQEEVRDVSPPVLPWAERPWHNIQESVALIQQHFVDCLAAGRTPETSGADNLRTFALVEAAYLSAAEGRNVALSEL